MLIKNQSRCQSIYCWSSVKPVTIEMPIQCWSRVLIDTSIQPQMYCLYPMIHSFHTFLNSQNTILSLYNYIHKALCYKTMMCLCTCGCYMYHYACINVKPEGGDPGQMWGILTFQKNFWSKSQLWGPKIWSDQIKYPQVFHQFIFKMSSQK